MANLEMKRRTVLAAAPVAALMLAIAPKANAAEVKERILGDESAPVTMIEFFSLTCPHCAQFHKDTFGELKKRYIETGKLRFIARDFPLDQNALRAAALAHCAGDDGYFRYVDVMFSTLDRWARSGDPEAGLIQLAQLGGMTKEDARACMYDDTLLDGILQMRLDAQKEFEIRSTPSLVINGEMYDGGRATDTLGAYIDSFI